MFIVDIFFKLVVANITKRYIIYEWNNKIITYVLYVYVPILIAIIKHLWLYRGDDLNNDVRTSNMLEIDVKDVGAENIITVIRHTLKLYIYI